MVMSGSSGISGDAVSASPVGHPNSHRFKCPGLEGARKVLICGLEMRSPEVVATQSPATFEREHYQAGSNSTYLGISQTQPARTLEQLFTGRTNQLGRSVGTLLVIHEAGDEHYRRGQRIGIDRIGRSQLEKLLGSHFREERGEMEQPILSVYCGLVNPLTKCPIARPAPAHGDRVERKAQISLDVPGFVVNDSCPRRIESPPELSAVTRPCCRLARVLP